MSNIKSPKKLIEVALPLDDINIACAHEKQPGIGAHPRGLHLWWARRPLPAARAVIFAQMVNDPGGERGYYTGKSKAQADIEREELFDIIRDLVKWENTNNEDVLKRAREAIRKSWRETCELNKGKEGFDPDKLPAFHDPFAGGGAIPLEAQRLGLESYASDLNPVAVMINKAMIEIPPRFSALQPIGPIPKDGKKPKLIENWSGAAGLAEDVRRYGYWIYEQALQRIGHLYPKVSITKTMVDKRPDLETYIGKELTVIAWIWTRTVKSPNPAYNHIDVPLVRSFKLSTKKGKEAYVETVIKDNSYHFEVRTGKEGPSIDGTVNRGGGTCIMSGSPMPFTYIRKEGKEGRMGQKLMAVICEGNRGRVYLSPNEKMTSVIDDLQPPWKPTAELPTNPRDFKTPNYGITTYGDLFTARQLTSLTTFSDLVIEARNNIQADAIAAGMLNDGKKLYEDGTGATAYADAISVYLAFSIDRLTDYNSTIATWKPSGEQVMQTFKRQALPMTWDFPESNVLAKKSICWLKAVQYSADNLEATNKISGLIPGHAQQQDAASQTVSSNKVISIDPPYYDNIGYADLSDYFYVWMRRTLKSVYPNLFATMAVPKSEELIATPYRHDNKQAAELFFLDGMTRAMQNLANQAHKSFPVTIYYAFKQSETKEAGTVSTGWETFIAAVIKAGFSITGTWPMRTELANRMIAAGSNALSSSVILVCRKRTEKVATISRREFQRELKEKMPGALESMIGGREGVSPIAPVDLAQAAIGPGMGIFSKYNAVLNQDGTNMSIHDALIMINKTIDEYFSDAEGELDEDSRFAVDWFMQYGFGKGIFGEADTLARAKGTSVELVKEAGVISSGQGKVSLLKWEDYPTAWDPTKDNRTPVWEACHHMIRVLNQKGESDAGILLAKIPQRAESIRQLAYRLYTLCERKGWADEARAYNELIGSWHSIVEASYEVGRHGEQQTLF